MPRHASANCDGQRPRCQNCIKGDRACQEAADGLRFVIHTPPLTIGVSRSGLQESPGDIPSYLPSPLDTFPPQFPEPQLEEYRLQEPYQSCGANFAEYLNDLVSCNPEEALKNTDVADVFCHYIEVLAPWYDLCDSERPYGTVLPIRALVNPVLFKALVAFSALHKYKIDGDGQGLSLAFHAACVHDLLRIVDGGNHDRERRADYLAATCLLRSYEILTGDSRNQQKHLMGAYLFSMGEPADMKSSGLLQAGVWNYLREEITVALECRRPVRTTLQFDFDPSGNYSDSMQANVITHLLARIINHCFKETREERTTTERLNWQSLRLELTNWEDQLPTSFIPYSTAGKANNPFPSSWLLQPWHVATQQYRYVAEILMAISNPVATSPGYMATEYALNICSLAFTNENMAARVNAFGPLAFCGRFLTTTHHRKGLKAMMIDFSKPTAWPVYSIIEDLEIYWQSLI